MPKLYIIAGCNGAGKTTASYTVLPEMLDCKEFVNADEIARGLSPFNSGQVNFQAGRLMRQRMEELMSEGADFAFETTLSTRSYVDFINRARGYGYFVSLLFFWLPSPEQAVERVYMRVLSGGHDIPKDVIFRRYERGLHNLLNLYIPICDTWDIYNNSSADADIKIIACGECGKESKIFDIESYNKIKIYE